MSGPGQKRKGSQRAYSVRITPKSRHHRGALALPICAITGTNAKALGATIPDKLIALGDEVISLTRGMESVS
jgi:hypothetical protein